MTVRRLGSTRVKRCRNWRCEDAHGSRGPLCWACRGAWALGLASGPLLAGLAAAGWALLSRLGS